MSNIKIIENSEEEAKDWEKLHRDLKDPSLWKPSDGESLEVAIAAVDSLKRGRPKSEKPTKGIFVKLPLELIDDLKNEAKELNIGYQSVLKMLVTKHFKEKKKAVDDRKTSEHVSK